MIDQCWIAVEGVYKIVISFSYIGKWAKSNSVIYWEKYDLLVAINDFDQTLGVYWDFKLRL